MRIAFVNEKCGYFGGVEQNIADSARLRGLGHTVFLAWGTRTDKDADGYRNLFDDDSACAELGAPAGRSFEQLLERWDPDVVYFHKAENAGTMLASMKGRQAVRMVHDHDLVCPRSHKYFAIGGQLCNQPAGWRCYFDGAFVGRGPGGLRYVDIGARLREMRRNYAFDRIIVASRFMRDELMMNGFPARRLAVLAPAVNLPALPATPPPGLGRVLFVGQLVRGKGVDLLIDAMATVQRPFILDIVGTGNGAEAFQAHAARRGIADQVKFHGWVSPESQSALYHDADVVVVPSRWPEPFGMVGPQAMRHGRPVVAFDVGGISDWLDHAQTGYLIPPHDVRAFGEAVSRLLDDADLNWCLGRRAHKIVLEKFSFERYLQALEGLLMPRRVPVGAHTIIEEGA